MTALLGELRRLIALEGPISVERYMALCLGHPVHGYYIARDPFGAGGDFTTAPEISQMFGELIGLWAADLWARLGAPRPVRLVELGPGRGTLMADLLRAARCMPGFREAAEVHLVETSPLLRERQRRTLAAAPVPVAWHASLGEVPPGPAIVVGNEFLDALPVRQFVRTERGWCERLVGLAGDRLAFGLAPEPEPSLPPAGDPGAVLEWPGAALALVGDLAARIRSGGGAALLVDYGYAGPAFGDTLQAVRRHAFTDPLAEPGEADLTVHVDFTRMAAAARAAGAAVHGPVTQAAFLRDLGIETRAATLQASARAEQGAAVAGALGRLTDETPGGMGGLFKALAVTRPDLGGLPGFPPPGQSQGHSSGHPPGRSLGQGEVAC